MAASLEHELVEAGTLFTFALILCGGSESVYLAAGDLLKLRLPTLLRPSDEQKYQAVPHLPRSVVGRATHASTITEAIIG